MEDVKICSKCGEQIKVTSDRVIIMPWPHIECPYCGHWIPLF